MPILPWNIDLTPELPGLTLETTHDFETGETTLTVTNTGATPLRPEVIAFTSPLPLKASGSTLWIHGRSAADDALIRVLGAPAESGYSGDYREALDDGSRYRSHEVLVLSVPAQGQPSLVIGCIETGRFFLDITVDVDGDEFETRRAGLVFHLENSVELAPGEALTLPAIHLREGGEPIGLIEGFADAAAEKMGARIPATPPSGIRFPSGAGQLTPGGNPGKYIVILASDQLSADAERVIAAGSEVGVALSPLVFPVDSPMVRDYPGLLLRDSSGDVFTAESAAGRGAVLDCTNPAAAEWLATSIRALAATFQPGYLELDMGDAAAPASEAVYHEAGATGPANVRRGLEIIREAAGDDMIIVASDCPFGPALGLADGMRTSSDAGSAWPEIRNAMGLALQRNWMNGRWWSNDPGTLLLGAGNSLTARERRFLATGIALCGGDVFVSGDLGGLALADREMALALAPSTGMAAQADDPGDGPVPSAWRATLADGRTLVGLLNFSDDTLWISQSQFLSPGEVAFDTWSGDLAGMGDIRIEPHDGLLFQVSLPGRGARVTGDSGHIAMADLAQREVSARVQVRNDRSYARTIAISARRNTTVHTLKPGEYRWFD